MTVELNFVFPESSRIGTVFLDQNRTIAVAESCTGGLLAAALSAPEGASGYFRGGVVVYTEEMKEKLLGVPHFLIENNGVVSDAVARSLACRVRELCNADVGIGITGFAGPTGGTEDAPLGTMYIAVASSDHEHEAHVVRLHGSKDREGNREMAVHTALAMIEEEVQVK